LGTSFGRGGATTFPADLVNSDCIVIEGSNMAECHPVAFRWIMQARERGATIIHVDPRFTRTSAVSNLHVPIRPGSDIVFLGAIVRYIIENERYFKEYVVHYTNASAVIHRDFRDSEDLDGLFSGPETWAYDGEKDPTLQDPRCVFQILKRHYARYTPEMVEEACGIPPRLFFKVAETLCNNSGRDKTGAFCYAVGWTQHSVGVQYIRTACIIQLLLGNMGRPGGGILALRGHASIQGSTDIPTLYDLLPGYLPMPHAETDESLTQYIERYQLPSGWWGEFSKYFVSLMKAWFGEAAGKDNDWCYRYLPLLTGDHSHMTTVTEMADGNVKGYFVMGENPVVGSMNGPLQRKGLRALDWLVVRDFQVTETADFWRESPHDIATEVIFFPAAAHTEKDGTFTNTQRLLQWHFKALDPPGAARSELDFVFQLGQILKDLYEGEYDQPRNFPLHDLKWDYEQPLAEAVLKEINGYTIADNKAVESYTALADDGSTACGCWIYSGCFADGVNQTRRRNPGDVNDPEGGVVSKEWAWAWPANRRILYNRASADPDGKPWSERKAYVWWDEEQEKWTGHDVPDFEPTKPPSYRPSPDASGVEALSGDDPFVMQADGKGWLFVPTGLLDGPLPAHYEPVESPVRNPFYRQQANPAREVFPRKDNPQNPSPPEPNSDVFPYVFTTYRLTEHHTAGGMSRWLPYLSELQPEFFCEVSPELAAERSLEHLGWATIVTARTAVEARVLVTERMTPLRVRGRTVHQIGLPYHWGPNGVVTGDAANDLLSIVLDSNVHIQESKAATCDIRPGRRPRGPALTRFVADYRRRGRVVDRPDAAGGS
jgi:formate dehydrogenase major subunit